MSCFVELYDGCKELCEEFCKGPFKKYFSICITKLHTFHRQNCALKSPACIKVKRCHFPPISSHHHDSHLHYCYQYLATSVSTITILSFNGHVPHQPLYLLLLCILQRRIPCRWLQSCGAACVQSKK